MKTMVDRVTLIGGGKIRGRPKKRPTETRKTIQQPDDDNIGKHVWVDTIGKKGSHFGFCKAVIEEKKRKGIHCSVCPVAQIHCPNP